MGNTITAVKPTVLIVANKVYKNHNWLQANQLPVYKRDQGVEFRTSKNKASWWLESGLNMGPQYPSDNSSALTARLSYNRRQNELRHFAQNWAFLRFINFKRKKYSFPPPSAPCNVVSLF